MEFVRTNSDLMVIWMTSEAYGQLRRIISLLAFLCVIAMLIEGYLLLLRRRYSTAG